MAGTGSPCTVVICCSLPAGVGSEEVAARLGEGRRGALPVTWLTAPEWLGVVVEAVRGAGIGGGIAVELPSGCPRSATRELLARARRVAPEIEAVAIRGPVDAACRRELAASGIRVLCRDGVEPAARGSRRPAPAGWQCHSPVWGMWEVAPAADPVPPTGFTRLLGIGWGSAVRPGSLAVIDIAHAAPVGGTAAPILRSRLGRWKSWAAFQRTRVPPAFAVLTQLPDLIARAGSVPVGGSVLRAA